jgi:hypothetical protein
MSARPVSARILIRSFFHKNFSFHWGINRLPCRFSQLQMYREPHHPARNLRIIPARNKPPFATSVDWALHPEFI